MPTGQATISIAMSVPFAPGKLTCTVLQGTERIGIKTINPNTNKNPKTNPNHNPNPPNNIIFREIHLFYYCRPTSGSLCAFYITMLWVFAIATGSYAAHDMAMTIIVFTRYTTILVR